MKKNHQPGPSGVERVRKKRGDGRHVSFLLFPLSSISLSLTCRCTGPAPHPAHQRTAPLECEKEKRKMM